jgi:hypothetical protein
MSFFAAAACGYEAVRVRMKGSGCGRRRGRGMSREWKE